MSNKDPSRKQPYFVSGPKGHTDYSDSMANDRGFYIDIYALHAKTRVAFKAFITSFTDNFDTGLDTTFFVGHPEPVRKIRSVDRQIQVGLDLIASNTFQAKQNLHDLSLLVKMVYPVLETSVVGGPQAPFKRTFVKSGGDPIFKVKFKNLIVGSKQNPTGAAVIDGLTGYIGNINYSFDLNSGFHNDPGDSGYIYPQLINLSFSFYPFNEKSPGWELQADGPNTGTYKFKRTNYPYAHTGVKGLVPASWAVTTSDSISKVNEARMKAILGDTK